jgi:DHA1 family inner membrane transport protein
MTHSGEDLAISGASAQSANHQAWLGDQLSNFAIAAVLGVCTFGLMLETIHPLLLDVIFRGRGLKAAEVGEIAALEMIGIALSSGLAGVYLERRNLRAIALASAIGLALANIATALIVSHAGLFVARALAGVCTGMFAWLYAGLLAKAVNPSRWGGVMTLVSGGISLLLSSFFASAIIPAFGATGVYWTLALVSIVSIALIAYIPHEYAGARQCDSVRGLPPPMGVGALAVVVLFMIAVTAISAYLGPLAARVGLSSSVVGTAVSFGLIGQMVGGLVAIVFGRRVPAVGATSIGTLCFIVGSMCLYNASSPWMFIAIVTVFRFCSVSLLQFQLTFVAEADPSRRSMMFVSLAHMLGGVAGPALSAWVVGSFGVRSVLGIAILGTSASLLTMLLIRFLRRAQKVSISTSISATDAPATSDAS